MKTKIIFPLVYFITQIIYAQTIQGTFIDQETKQAIPHLTAISKDQSIIITSNKEGQFTLDVSALNKTFVVDDFTYEYSEKTITGTNTFTWELTSNAETLEEIVTFMVPIKKIMNEIIDNSIKQFQTNTQIKTYYRENYKKYNILHKYAEGIVNFYVGNKLKKVISTVDQSRTFNADQEDSNISSTFSPVNLVTGSMGFNMLKNIINDKTYEFYTIAKTVGTRRVHILHFAPNEKTTDRFLMEGYVIFDLEKKIILETNIKFSEEKKQYNKPINILIAKLYLDDITFITKYIDAQNLYYPTYAQLDVVARAIAKRENKKVTMNTSSYFYTLQVIPNQKIPANQKDAFENGSLYEYGDDYKTEFWKDEKLRGYRKF